VVLRHFKNIFLKAKLLFNNLHKSQKKCGKFTTIGCRV
jgi:hypothetical protein